MEKELALEHLLEVVLEEVVLVVTLQMQLLELEEETAQEV